MVQKALDSIIEILSMHCRRLKRYGDDKINSECVFLREKVFRLIERNLNGQNYFPYTKDVLAELQGLNLISLASGVIRLKT